MKRFYEIGKYYQWIEAKENKIIKSSCTCKDFMFRKLKKKEEKVIQIGDCKHIQRIKLYLNGKNKAKPKKEKSA